MIISDLDKLIELLVKENINFMCDLYDKTDKTIMDDTDIIEFVMKVEKLADVSICDTLLEKMFYYLTPNYLNNLIVTETRNYKLKKIGI